MGYLKSILPLSVCPSFCLSVRLVCTLRVYPIYFKLRSSSYINNIDHLLLVPIHIEGSIVYSNIIIFWLSQVRKDTILAHTFLYVSHKMSRYWTITTLERNEISVRFSSNICQYYQNNGFYRTSPFKTSRVSDIHKSDLGEKRTWKILILWGKVQELPSKWNLIRIINAKP